VLDTLITSKTRIKLLLKFFSNKSNSAYLRSLAEEFGESTNSVRVELNRLAKAGLLESEPSGNTVLYKANTRSPLFPDLQNIVSKYLGFDHIIEQVILKIGDVEAAFITGSYANGKDTGIIDLVVIGKVNKDKMNYYTERAEVTISKKIRTLILSKEEFHQHKVELVEKPHILLWGQIK
jgi:predicted nucleotidyltransferase